MEERYPFVRFVIDAAQVIAGAIALIVLLSGTVSACSHGGFGGLVAFIIAVVVAGSAYVAVMVTVELMRALLDIENTTRQQLAASQQPEPPTSASTGT